MTSTVEQGFIAATTDLHWQTGDLQDELRQLDDWLARLIAEYSGAPLRHAGLLPSHALAQKAGDLNRQLSERAPVWRQQRQDLEAAQAVASALDQRAIFLVFGKFNAGKSSLCNFLADRFVAQGQQVEYFRIEAGRIVTTPQRFKEGATETTTTLQGVFLGHKLVLLDTPGLHSVSPENAELTQRFTDSADGVLWLTSSSSPGQVQELDELARELRRAKPLLPVVSRSDYLEEDEIDGEIVKLLLNKSPATRKLQQDDVLSRGREKLGLMAVDPNLLQTPVSVSVYAAHQQGNTDAAMQVAGFDDFWAAFAAIVEPALEYKQRKYAEIVLHHGEESVMHDLQQRILPQLNVLSHLAAEEKSSLENRQELLKKRVWRSVIPELPGVIEHHAGLADADALSAVCEQTSVLLKDAVGHGLVETLGGYEVDTEDAGFEIEIGALDRHDLAGIDAALEQSIQRVLNRVATQAIDQCRQAVDSFEFCLMELKNCIRTHQSDLMAIRQNVRAGRELAVTSWQPLRLRQQQSWPPPRHSSAGRSRWSG